VERGDVPDEVLVQVSLAPLVEVDLMRVSAASVA
jgi:hypothetical protein